jgi:histidinol-phosphate aminotransferase
MSLRPPFSRIVQKLPPTGPFVPPEAIERKTGKKLALRLGANESSFGVSPLALQAMKEAIQHVPWYGDAENYDLRQALARQLAVGMDNIVIGSGIDELLGLTVRLFLNPGDTVVTSTGAYPTFDYHVEGYGGHIHYVPYRHEKNDLQGLAEAAKQKKARIVYLANPDNPTGTIHTPGDLKSFIAQIPPDCLLILDEAYGEFAPDEAILPMDPSDPRVIRMRTFSKAYGMAGARIGYAVSERKTIAAFEKIRNHFGVNNIAQAGALAALQDREFLQKVVREVAEGRREYDQLAKDLGLSTIPSVTNFVTFNMGSDESARAVINALSERGVFVRRPETPPFNRYIRVTVGTPAERAQFSDIFREVVHKRL